MHKNELTSRVDISYLLKIGLFILLITFVVAIVIIIPSITITARSSIKVNPFLFLFILYYLLILCSESKIRFPLCSFRGSKVK